MFYGALTTLPMRDKSIEAGRDVWESYSSSLV